MFYLFIKYIFVVFIINENVDLDVCMDFESIFNYVVLENFFFFIYIIEGFDDMFVYIKVVMIGFFVIIFIIKGWFNLGIWQGIYFCEFCNYGGSWKLVVMVYGQLVFLQFIILKFEMFMVFFGKFIKCSFIVGE